MLNLIDKGEKMAEIRNCGCTDCTWNAYGECEAEEVDVNEELTAAGFLPICQTYIEKEED